MPQGFIQGPLLFLVFVNDLPDSISHQSSVALFADDTKCYRFVTKVSDCEILQSGLHNLVQRCSDWKMELNLCKRAVTNPSASARVQKSTTWNLIGLLIFCGDTWCNNISTSVASPKLLFKVVFHLKFPIFAFFLNIYKTSPNTDHNIICMFLKRKTISKPEKSSLSYTNQGKTTILPRANNGIQLAYSIVCNFNGIVLFNSCTLPKILLNLILHQFVWNFWYLYISARARAWT